MIPTDKRFTPRYVGLRFSTPRLGIQATEDERLRLWLREVERTLNQEVEVMTATEVAKRIAEFEARVSKDGEEPKDAGAERPR